MFDIKKDIQAMTTFRRNPAKFLKQLKKTRKPLILTINGKAEAVVQYAEAYQRLLGIAAQADAPARRAKPWKRFGAPVPYLVRLTERALRDMEAIYESIEADSSESAAAWFKKLSEAVYRK